MNKSQNNISVKWAIVTLAVVVIFICVSIAALSLRPEKEVTDFASCKVAGGAILESYPEQCNINGMSYTNNSQSHPELPPQSVGYYTGLSENEALAKAEKDDVPARVVERDGEGLAVTMDFVFGRHNLYVKDNVVYKDEIEGEGQDTPKITE